MAERTKPGEILRHAYPNDYVWLKGLLRYTRDAEIGTNVPGDVPNMTTVFCGFTSTYRRGELTLLFKSYAHTDHALAILDTLPRSKMQSPLDANVALKVVNSSSPDINLMLKGWAEPVPPEDIDRALAEYNAIRRLKGVDEANLGPKNNEDDAETLFAVKIVWAQTQGQRYSLDQEHVAEGHPSLIIQKLLGFEGLPALDEDQPVPRTKEKLAAHLVATRYFMPVDQVARRNWKKILERRRRGKM